MAGVDLAEEVLPTLPLVFRGHGGAEGGVGGDYGVDGGCGGGYGGLQREEAVDALDTYIQS